MTMMSDMHTASVARLKAQLSRYLRLVQLGERVVVVSRNRPVAELIPTRRKQLSVWERLAAEGKCKLPTRPWRSVRISRLKKPVPYREALDWVRGEP